MSSLAEWNEQFGDMEFFPKKAGAGGGGGFTFELEVAYPCRIKKAKCTRSKFGDLQLEMQWEVQAGESEGEEPTLGETRTWLTLPKQPGDMKRDRDTVIKMTQRRYQDLLRILSAAAPARFALYAEKKEGADKKNTFFDFDGQVMDGSDFNDREQDIHSSCVDFADKLGEGDEVELLEGTLLYILKSKNPRNEKYPYVNYYASRPTKKKVYQHSGDSVPF